MGTRLREANIPLQTYWFNKGMVDAAKGESDIDSHRAMMIINEYFSVVLPMQNKQESEAWLAKVEKKRGVKKTESGLLYRIDRMGDESIKPTATDKVTVDYEGKTKDGKVFERDVEVLWQCSNCGHQVMAKHAPGMCPVCRHPQAYFQIKAENY